MRDLRLSPVHAWLIALTFAAAGLRIIWGIAIYDASLLPYHSGDYTLYRIGAEEILTRGWDFSNSIFLIRPPAFPLLVAALRMNPLAILAVNTLLGTLIVPATYALARAARVRPWLGFAAAALVALDLTSIKFSAVLLAEPLANFLLVLGWIALLYCQQASSLRRSLYWGIAAALLMSISAYSRPAAYLIWIPAGLWFIGTQYRQWRRWLVGSAMLIIIIGSTGIWIWHNAVVFSHATFSTIGVYNLAYYRAASVLYWGHPDDLSIDGVYTLLAREIEAEAGNDTSEVTADTRYSHTAATAEISRAMTQVSLDAFREYPLYYVLTIPVGIVRLLITTVTFSPLLDRLILVWNGAFTLAALTGLWVLWQRQQWTLFWFILLFCGYFIGGTLLVQTSGIDTRARSMITPLMSLAVICNIKYFDSFKLFEENQ